MMWVFLGHLIIDFLAAVGQTASRRSVKCPKMDLNRSSTATDGPILVQKVSKHMFFGSGNPFLPLPKLYSGQECNNINSRLMGVFVTRDGKNSTISLNP